ncbi:hypothetical protein HDU96_005557 [Phlyctochytrium bullatum]|nr:hypothetical protein HDU96_005557 [Phlyctochytrium bullatum]
MQGIVSARQAVRVAIERSLKMDSSKDKETGTSTEEDEEEIFDEEDDEEMPGLWDFKKTTHRDFPANDDKEGEYEEELIDEGEVLPMVVCETGLSVAMTSSNRVKRQRMDDHNEKQACESPARDAMWDQTLKAMTFEDWY